MAVKLEIGLKQLNEPGVAEALARLVDALGGGKAVSRAAPAPSRRAAPPQVKDDGLDDAARYTAFINQLPERSRAFVDLVREHKVLRISHAMKVLGITAPKAMGGLTGSIGRWAPIRGVKVPYEMTMVEGERAWRWLGSPLDEKAAAAAPQKAAKPVPPANRAGHTPTVVPAPAPPAPESVPPASEPAEAPASASTDDAAADQARRANPDLRAFEGLPEKSQQFITLVAARGFVSREQALEALGLRRPKALGGVTEPIIRRCRDLNIDRPFLQGKQGGMRVWLWPTQDVPGDVELDLN